MYGAGEIHRFNRDVEEALTRIQEKYSSIPDEQGRDLFATQSYLKKHERFENELVALEAQVIVWYKWLHVYEDTNVDNHWACVDLST